MCVGVDVRGRAGVCEGWREVKRCERGVAEMKAHIVDGEGVGDVFRRMGRGEGEEFRLGWELAAKEMEYMEQGQGVAMRCGHANTWHVGTGLVYTSHTLRAIRCAPSGHAAHRVLACRYDTWGMSKLGSGGLDLSEYDLAIDLLPLRYILYQLPMTFRVARICLTLP